jgi:hypothetical protein
MTPKQMIESYATARSELAQKIRMMRQAMREKPINRDVFPIAKENKLVRELMYNPIGYGMVKAPIKPTVDNFACLAEVYTLYGRAPLPWERDPYWVNPKSTEYYSACGYEDYLFEQREEARKFAEELIEAVDWLLEQEHLDRVAEQPYYPWKDDEY